MTMITLEQVEKLRQRANVSYDEAREALENCNGDLLDAVIYLEKQGKTGPSYQENFMHDAGQEQHYYSNPNYNQSQQQYQQKTKGPGFAYYCDRFFNWVGSIFNMGNRNHFLVQKNGETFLDIPLTIFVILLIACFYVVVPLLIVGLFFGFRYSFYGQEIVKTPVNEAVNKVHNMVDSMQTEAPSDAQTVNNDGQEQ